MLISEFLRTDEPDLKYATYAFALLSIHRLISVLVIMLKIFTGFEFLQLITVLPIVHNGLETTSIALLAFAFTYALFNHQEKRHNKTISRSLIAILVFTVIAQISWIITLYTVNGAFRYEDFWANICFVILNIIIICWAIYVWIFKAKRNSKHRVTIILAFSSYLVVFLLQLTNIILYNSNFSNLQVAQTPFPGIAIILFARVVYLRLVDKARLLDRLKLSERKIIEEKEISKMKDEFISVASHEFRTPLTAMKLHTALLKDKEYGEINKEQQDALNIIDEEIDRLTKLVNDTLDLSKLESKKYRSQISHTDIVKVIRDNQYYLMAEKKGIKIVLNLPEKLEGDIDVAKFQQLLINLLSNAIKFTDAGGTITISAKDGKDRWSFSVSDTGRGIPRSKIPYLFNKFYQVDTHMTRNQGGTGLGLSIVKNIVEIHKGKIRIQSKLGQGTSFIIELPKNLKNAKN